MVRSARFTSQCRSAFVVAGLLALALTAPRTRAGDTGTYADGSPASADEANYDRLDGTGSSGKKVQVIDWEGNMELHVFPKGSLKGLALKIDHANKDKPVMVIGYRFTDQPKTQLIRRALLTMPMADGFKVFKDPTEPDFDKIVISNNGLSGDLVAYQLEAPPKQLYPDGHPALAQGAQGAQAAQDTQRTPASPASKKNTARTQRAGRAPKLDDNGTIQPFLSE